MIEDKKLSELAEASLIWVLSAAVAALGFLAVWLVCMFAGFGRA